MKYKINAISYGTYTFFLELISIFKTFVQNYIAIHNSVVITVLSMGIFDFSDFLLLMTLSCTSQGDISSMFPLVLFLFVSLLVEFLIFFAVFPLFVFLCWLLLITLERLPLLPRDSVWLEELSLLFVFLLELELVLARFEPTIRLLIKTGKFSRWQNLLKTGSLLDDDCCPTAFFPTLDSDLVTGWLCAKEVSCKQVVTIRSGGN